jgi:hypothetical protein
MKIAVSSDARTHLADAILEDLGKRGREVEYLGPEQDSSSTDVAVHAAGAGHGQGVPRRKTN